MTGRGKPIVRRADMPDRAITDHPYQLARLTPGERGRRTIREMAGYDPEPCDTCGYYPRSHRDVPR